MEVSRIFGIGISIRLTKVRTAMGARRIAANIAKLPEFLRRAP
jgi:hypothetical protein